MKIKNRLLQRKNTHRTFKKKKIAFILAQPPKPLAKTKFARRRGPGGAPTPTSMPSVCGSGPIIPIIIETLLKFLLRPIRVLRGSVSNSFLENQPSGKQPSDNRPSITVQVASRTNARFYCNTTRFGELAVGKTFCSGGVDLSIDFKSCSR